MFDLISDLFRRDPLAKLHRFNESVARADKRNKELETELLIEEVVQNKIRADLDKYVKAVEARQAK